MLQNCPPGCPCSRYNMMKRLLGCLSSGQNVVICSLGFLSISSNVVKCLLGCPSGGQNTIKCPTTFCSLVPHSVPQVRFFSLFFYYFHPCPSNILSLPLTSNDFFHLKRYSRKSGNFTDCVKLTCSLFPPTPPIRVRCTVFCRH